MIYISSVLLTLCLLPFFFLLAVISLAAIPVLARRRGFAETEHFLILIPAHNEAAVIEATMASVNKLQYPRERFRVLVIADNCEDNTAELARAAGVEVFERRDEKRRGKGYALEDAISKSLNNPAGKEISAVVVIDADTMVDPNLLKAFAGYLAAGCDWIQGYYNGSNPDVSWRTKLLYYALALINGVWLAGEEGLGLGASLRGNGMCFSRRGLERQPWRAASLAEDIEFAWLLRLGGEKVFFAPNAKVAGELVSRGGAGAENQRQRWEHGRRALRRQFRPRIMQELTEPLGKKILHLCNLYMLPLAKLATFLSAAVALNFLAVYQSRQLLALQVLMALALAFYALMPFLFLRVPLRYLMSISHLPRFVWWKLRLYFKTSPQAWVRTERENERKKGRP